MDRGNPFLRTLGHTWILRDESLYKNYVSHLQLPVFFDPSVFWKYLDLLEKMRTEQVKLGGGFKYFFIFTPTWGRFPFWLIFYSDGLKPPTRKHVLPNGGEQWWPWFTIHLEANLAERAKEMLEEEKSTLKDQWWAAWLVTYQETRKTSPKLYDSPPLVPIILCNPGNFNLFGWKTTWIPGHSRIITPWKIHMEPENHRENHLKQTIIFWFYVVYMVGGLWLVNQPDL